MPRAIAVRLPPLKQLQRDSLSLSCYLLDRQGCSDPRCRQLYGQGHTVQPPADLGHRPSVLGASARKLEVRGLGPFHEQPAPPRIASSSSQELGPR